MKSDTILHKAATAIATLAIAAVAGIVMIEEARATGPQSTSQNTPRGCDYHDSWRGLDKRQHALGGALIGGAVTMYTGDWRYGVGAGVVAGLVKEATGYCSAQDAIATALGGVIGSAIGHGISVTLDPERKYVWIGFRKELK